MPNRQIMFIAGEASGDMRAAGLARAIKSLDPSVSLTGIGGPAMRQAGVDTFTDITELAIIGIAEVIKHFGRIRKVFYHALDEIDRIRPDCVILVDYPGFNLRLAAQIKKRRIKTIYYISPQVWAWREKRVLKIKQLVDRMIVLFPFEKDVYKKYGMEVDYVGHPLAEEVKSDRPRQDVLASVGLSGHQPTIGLLPGSRAKEIERHLPCLLDAAAILFKNNKDRQFLLMRAPSIRRELLEDLTRARKAFPLKIYEGPIYDGINAVDGCLVASGTATLECALLMKPMVIIYKTSWVTYQIAKALIKIPYIGLVNIVAGKKIAEELIQDAATAVNIAEKFEIALRDKGMIGGLAAVKSSLGQPGASLRAAQVVLEELGSKTKQG